MFWVKELGLSTGPQRQSVRLGNTGPRARAWKSWFSTTHNTAAGNKRKKLQNQMSLLCVHINSDTGFAKTVLVIH